MTLETPLIDIRPDHWEIVRGILKKHVSQHEVWAFGSRATWKAKEFSDLDLAIITEHPLSLDISASLSEDFSNSDLPYKVDVVDWATTSESFRKIIERDKVEVQEGTRCLGKTGDWPTAKIGDVCLRVTKGTTPTTGGGAYADKGIAFIKVEAITDSGGFLPEKFAFIDAKTDERLARSRLQDKDILFTIAGTIGRVAQVANDILPANINQAVAIVRPNPDLIFPRYLYYVLRDSERIQLAKSKVVQSVQANFSLGELSSIELPLPPQNEQRAIAHILGALDDKIELNRKQNETLEAMARALFKAWFVDFEPVRAKMEGRWQRGQSLPGLPAHIYDLFPDRIVESESGDIPAGWRVFAFGDVAQQGKGAVNPGNSPQGTFTHYSLPAFDSAQSPYIELGSAIKSNKTPVPDGAVLVSKLNPHIPRVWQVGKAGANAVCSTEFIVWTPRPPANNAFLYCLASSSEFNSAMRQLVTGTSNSHQRVKPDQLRDIRVFTAVESVIEAFSEAVRLPMEQVIQNRQQSHALAQLRDTLLPKLISGELRVSDAERIVGAAI